MRYVSRVVLLTLTAAFVFVLSACGEQTPEFASVTDPTHFYEEVREGFLIDAEVYGMPAGMIPCVYVAEPQRFTQEDIGSFLESNGDQIVASQNKTTAYYDIYSGTCTSGSEFLYQVDANGHPFSVFQYVNKAKSLFIQSYPIYYGEETFLTNPAYMVGGMLTEQKDLSFASAGQAEQEVREKLAALGLGELILIRTLYIDYQTMKEVGELVSTDDNYAPIGDPQKNNGYPVKDNWSAADDAYMFSFVISVNGAPMSYYWDQTETATYSGNEVIVWFTADGIVSLTVTTPWSLTEKDETQGVCVSAGAALTLAKEKLGNVLTYDNLIIEKIALEYYYAQNGNTWSLIPIWLVTASYEMEYSNGRNYEYIRVDATTGLEI